MILCSFVFWWRKTWFGFILGIFRFRSFSNFPYQIYIIFALKTSFTLRAIYEYEKCIQWWWKSFTNNSKVKQIIYNSEKYTNRLYCSIDASITNNINSECTNSKCSNHILSRKSYHFVWLFELLSQTLHSVFSDKIHTTWFGCNLVMKMGKRICQTIHIVCKCKYHKHTNILNTNTKFIYWFLIHLFSAKSRQHWNFKLHCDIQISVYRNVDSERLPTVFSFSLSIWFWGQNH